MNLRVLSGLVFACLVVWGALWVTHADTPKADGSNDVPTSAPVKAAHSADPFAAALSEPNKPATARLETRLPEHKGKDPFSEFLDKQKVSPFGAKTANTDR